MMRIIALNDSIADTYDDEIQIAKEAQEAIVESEYVRLVRLINDGKLDLASSLIHQLLNTNVLNEIATEDGRKLWTIRYNCYKLLAIICEEKKEFDGSLQYYIQALQLDNSDISTLYRLGQLALNLKQDELAEYAFESCLRHNKRHWAAIEGLLEVYDKNHNFFGSFSLGRELFANNIYSRQAKKNVCALMTFLKKNVFTIEKFFGKLNVKRNFHNESLLQESNLTLIPDNTNGLLPLPKNIIKFSLNDVSFQSIGNYLITTLKLLGEQNSSFLFTLTFQDIFLTDTENKDLIEPCSGKTNLELESNIDQIHDRKIEDDNVSVCSEEKEVKCRIYEGNVEMANNVDTLNPKSEEDTGKIKSRRRCSDLHHLEQWSWHKNKKTTRKKSSTDRSTFDTTLSGFLNKAFSKFMNANFEEPTTFGLFEFECAECSEKKVNSNFEQQTIDELNSFIKILKEVEFFDLAMINYYWLSCVSKYWNKIIPDDLKTIYMELFMYYTKNLNFHMSNEPSMETFYEISIYFLELQFANAFENNLEIPHTWMKIFKHLTNSYGLTLLNSDTVHELIRLRLLNLEFLQYNINDKFEESLNVLKLMKTIVFAEKNTNEMHLPHLKSFCITFKNLEFMMSQLQRKIMLKQIPIMFAKKQWAELSQVIDKDISYNQNFQMDKNTLDDFKHLNQILLQCYWNNAKYEECLSSTEKWLHIAIHNYLRRHDDVWKSSISYALSYVEALILNEGIEIITSLDDKLSRLIQNLVRLLSFQLDGDTEKTKQYISDEVEMRRSWIILHQIIVREENIRVHNEDITSLGEENDSDHLPMSFLLLFTAHEYLGKKQICTNDGGTFLQYVMNTIIPSLRAPIYDSCRNNVYEYIEQVTYCMYGFPPKRARSRHLEDHNSKVNEITWKIALDIFDVYAPESLPEFNSYKVESISSDMEQFSLKVLSLLPTELENTNAINFVKTFIDGDCLELNLNNNFELPFKIKNIYYLLADFYFKSRDFNKAIKYYMLDIAVNINRFDSWAGISLSKASDIETKLNGYTKIDMAQFLNETDTVIRCFNKCISFRQNHVLLWIEYGSFAYAIGSFCSRKLKKCKSENNLKWISILSKRKDEMLNIATNCFSLASGLQNADYTNFESNEEKWLCQYMLGKIAEKRREKPTVYLKYYLTASNFLYECNATYPIKINHSNPTTLSVEALEIYYRTNAAIMKYTELGHEITKDILILFKNVLGKLSNSPFAFNKAKIDGICLYALKRKSTSTNENTVVKKKTVEGELSSGDNKPTSTIGGDPSLISTDKLIKDQIKSPITTDLRSDVGQSQESCSTSGSSTSSNYESDSSSMDNQLENSLDAIYEELIKNLEECVIRFPEHYKSIYRLVHIYMYGPKRLRDLNKCENLLLNQYRTNVGNVINGLFYDRKINNLFNGIWRIPSSEIDRPGSFSAHLIKCVDILIELLKKQNNYKLLIDIILQLYKTPDNDKRYVMDADRIQIYKKAINYCEDMLRDILEQNKISRNDSNLLDLLIDIYKLKKKCYKYMQPKDVWFSKIFTDVYIFYIENKVNTIPKNFNYTDLAVKLCVQEINHRKNYKKILTTPGTDGHLSCSTSSENSTAMNLSDKNCRSQLQTPTDDFSVEPFINQLMIPQTSTANVNTFEMTANYSRFLGYWQQILEGKHNENLIQTSVPSLAPADANLQSSSNNREEEQTKTLDSFTSLPQN